MKDFNWFSFNGRFFYGEITFWHTNKKSEHDEKEYRLYFNHTFTYDDYPDDLVYAVRYPGMAKFFGRCEDDEWYYMAMCAQNYMLKVSKTTGKFFWIKPKGISYEEKTRFYIKKGVAITNESSEYGISAFLNYARYKHTGIYFEKCGKNIYEVMR